MNRFLSVVFNVEYDATNKTTISDVFLKIDVSALRGGLLQKIKGSDLTVLLAIASFMDNKGSCYPTQRQIAAITGMSITTVNRSIANLLEIEVNGKPVIERVLKGSGQKKSSIYTIFDIAPDDIEIETFVDPELDVDVEKVPGETVLDPNTAAEDVMVPCDKKQEIQEIQEVKEKPKTARDHAHYFADKYKEVYGIGYVIHYKRDLALIKNKLMATYTEQQIQEILDICITEYKGKWSNSKYPYPTISMLCSWLCVQAVQIIQKNQEKSDLCEEMVVNTAEFIDADYSDFDNI